MQTDRLIIVAGLVDSGETHLLTRNGYDAPALTDCSRPRPAKVRDFLADDRPREFTEHLRAAGAEV